MHWYKPIIYITGGANSWAILLYSVNPCLLIQEFNSTVVEYKSHFWIWWLFLLGETVQDTESWHLNLMLQCSGVERVYKTPTRKEWTILKSIVLPIDTVGGAVMFQADSRLAVPDSDKFSRFPDLTPLTQSHQLITKLHRTSLGVLKQRKW